MLKFLLYTCILFSFFFLLLGKSYSWEQLIAANFLADKGIIHDWSRIPPRYKFNEYILLVDALNMSLSLNNIKKNIDCRWDYAERLSPYNLELCRTFEATKDAGLFQSEDTKIFPLQFITYKDFFDIMAIWNMNDKYTPLPYEKIKRWEAFVLLYKYLHQQL
jgi:hypothetical protein